jgi:mitofilin
VRIYLCWVDFILILNFSHKIRALLEAGHGDVVIEAAVKSLPSDVVKNGAPSVAQLQDRFKYVQGVGRRAALVPENAGIVGQLFGGALSYLLIPPGGPIEGKRGIENNNDLKRL